MDKKLATTIFESLASGVRLDVYRLLVKNAPNGLVAGEIASGAGFTAHQSVLSSQSTDPGRLAQR